MKRINFIPAILVILIGYLMLQNVERTKTYELIITDESGNSKTLIMTDTNNDGQLEFLSYKR
jgi:hypothetical protein